MKARNAPGRPDWTAQDAALSARDRITPLQPPDLERLGVAVYLAGDEPASIDANTRAHNLALANGDIRQAVRSAFWVAFALVGARELTRAGGWAARAAARRASVRLGRVRVRPPAAGLQHVAAGELPVAVEVFEAAERMPSFSFPTKDEMADYLEGYAKHFGLPVRTNTRVKRLWRDGPTYVVETGDRCFEAEHVVIAMATHQVPRVPDFAEQLDQSIVQLHSSQYKNAGQLQAGDVLAAGAGNSGATSPWTWSARIARGSPGATRGTCRSTSKERSRVW